MTLLITLLLVLLNLFGTVIQLQPPSKHPTALAIWTLCCIMFVSGALVAYAVLLFKKYNPRKIFTGHHITYVQGDTKGKQSKQQMNFIDSPVDLAITGWDKGFLITFPIMFLIFNSIYWPAVKYQHPLDIRPPTQWET